MTHILLSWGGVKTSLKLEIIVLQLIEEIFLTFNDFHLKRSFFFTKKEVFETIKVCTWKIISYNKRLQKSFLKYFLDL